MTDTTSIDDATLEAVLKAERERVFAILRHGKIVPDPEAPGTTILVDWDDLEEGIAAVESGAEFAHLEETKAVAPFVRSLEDTLRQLETSVGKTNNPKAEAALRVATKCLRNALGEIRDASVQVASDEAANETPRRMLERVRRALQYEDRDAVFRTGTRIGGLMDAIQSVLTGVRKEGSGDTVDEALAAIAREPRTFSWNGNVRTVQNPNLTDRQVAEKVRMLMRDDLAHESVCTLARDRIAHLSERLAEVETILSGAKP